MDNIDQLLAPFIPDIRLLICAYALPDMCGILEDILKDNGDAVLVQWILRELSSDDPNIRPNVAVLWWASRWGHSRLVEWLSERRSLVMILDISRAFGILCEYGHLELAKWLVSERKLTDYHASFGRAFRLSCVNGQLEVAKWLVSEFRTAAAEDVKSKDNYVFKNVCIGGRLDIVELLVTEFKFTAKDVEASIDRRTLGIIRSDSRHVLKWLNSKFNLEYMA